MSRPLVNRLHQKAFPMLIYASLLMQTMQNPMHVGNSY